MMYEVFFFALFGLLMIISAFLVVAWGVLSYRRARELRFTDMLRDRYLVLACALTVNAFGAGLLFGARVGAVLFDRLPPVTVTGIAGAILGVGTFCLLLSKLGFVWGIDMHKKGSWWVIFLSFSALWIFLSVAWALY